MNDESKWLAELLTKWYSLGEMRLLCYKIGCDLEEFGEKNIKSLFAQELASHCYRNNLLSVLTNQMAQEKPHIFDNSYQYEQMANEVSHYDHDTYSDSTDDNDEDSGCLSTIVIRAFIAFVIIGVLYLVYSNHQKQAMLREPDEFIGDYFRLLGTGQHSSAWERLSGDYRINKYITGYVPYSEYWRSYKRIEILSLEILNETPTQASVSVFLTLTKLDDTVVNESITFQLERTGSNEVWIITDSSP